MKKYCQYQWLNCTFGLVYLIYRGKVSTVGLMINNKDYTLHWVGFNKRGNLLHFRTHKPNIGIKKLWFYGRFSGIGKSKIDKILGNRKCLKLKIK